MLTGKKNMKKKRSSSRSFYTHLGGQQETTFYLRVASGFQIIRGLQYLLFDNLHGFVCGGSLTSSQLIRY